MKSRYLLLAGVLIIATALKTVAQDATNGKLAAKTAIPFGKKLPPPSLTILPGNSAPDKVRYGQQNFNPMRMKDFNANDIKKDPARFKQTLLQMQNNRARFSQNAIQSANDANEDQSIDFHLTKDIDTLTESSPRNYDELHYHASYAILNDVLYFSANDGIHGDELWRSDGTEAGTYMVKDIEPGIASSTIYNITAINGKLYFSAVTATYGWEPWVSDGTETGTHLLIDVNPGADWSYAGEFIGRNNAVYFVANDNSNFRNMLWKTDGTTANTKLVIDLQDGYEITQLTTAHDLLFFIFYSYQSYSYELWRSDGTKSGTFHVGSSAAFNDFPEQLTKYNDKLYFSADDGTGRKLWISDGTDTGTRKAPNNNGVLIDADYMGVSFPVLNNVLYMPGTSVTSGSALYKYDASNNNGVIKVKDITAEANPDFIVPSEMEIVHGRLYFKVTNYNGGMHDELWSSDGYEASTQLIKQFATGETISNLYDGAGNLYFDKYDNNYGNELWKLVNSPVGTFTIIEGDIFKGATSSYPDYLTAFKNKLFFSATNDKKGRELFVTTNLGIGATIVKDINTVATTSSDAGNDNGSANGTYGNMAALKNKVLFNAYENVHGNEIYTSCGTQQDTRLLNDITPGEAGSYPYQFLSKNDNVYFISSADTVFSIYKSNGTKTGLQKITPDLDSYNYYVLDYNVADNGLVFYILYDYISGIYELWRSNGITAGTYLLSSTVYHADGLHVAGNTAFFVAGDAKHGYELWKSDGSTDGTAMVKDINPGVADAFPGGLFVYNNEVYFSANNGSDINGNTGIGFWKSDGTKAGTIKLKNIDCWYGNTAASTAYFFCILNNILYFSALNYDDEEGTKLWKTDGTPQGTQAVKDINPTDNGFFVEGPYNLTDVNGELFFMDGFQVSRLWKSDGTTEGTKLVKDVASGEISNLVSYGGKLYFIVTAIDGIIGNVTGTSLWSSDGTKAGTQPVNDPVINQLYIYNMIAAGDHLFISGSSSKYGTELYAATTNEAGQFAAVKAQNLNTAGLNMLLYPNPAKDVVSVKLDMLNNNASLIVTDISGKTILNKNINSVKGETILQLNISQLAAGTYFIKLISADGIKTSIGKFEKQ